MSTTLHDIVLLVEQMVQVHLQQEGGQLFCEESAAPWPSQQLCPAGVSE